MAEGLRTVLRLVQKHQSLCVYWTVNYSVQDPALRAHLLSLLRKARCILHRAHLSPLFLLSPGVHIPRREPG